MSLERESTSTTSVPTADRPTGADGELTFPDLPRLEFDDLLGQLVERAQEVMATQGRLRGLLRANQALLADLELNALLQRLTSSARELVGASTLPWAFWTATAASPSSSTPACPTRRWQ